MISSTSKKFSIKKMITLGFILFGCLLLLLFSGSLVEFVQRGQYHIIQYPSGTMRAVFDTGPYAQWFGSVSPWPTSETFYFTADEEGGKGNYSVKNVQFRDGSFVAISGTTRVILPSDSEKAIGLMIHHNYKNFSDLEDRLILPTVRAAFIRTANLMTAQESYSSKRADFINWAWDQIENGLYKTIEVTRDVPRADDPNRTERKIVREILYKDEARTIPLREKNPLDGTGIRLANFEIKEFQYDSTVVKQIADQQKNLMGIETAKAEAERAKQDAIKAEEEGKAKYATAKWKQEEVNAKEIAEAEKNKRVAELDASRKLEVAKLNNQSAEQIKQEQIKLGQGEAERKRLVMDADGALEKKLAAIVQMNADNAKALSERSVPTYYFAGSGGADGSASGSYDDEMVRQLRLMNMNSIKSLNLDLDVKKQ